MVKKEKKKKQHKTEKENQIKKKRKLNFLFGVIGEGKIIKQE